MANSVMKNIFLFSIICLALFISDTAVAAPSGYCAMENKEVTPEIGRIAKSMLGNLLGTCTPFTSAAKNYTGCVEWHWDQKRGQHKGVTVYKECKPKCSK